MVTDGVDTLMPDIGDTFLGRYALENQR
jgi:hypothetical protein